MCGILVLVLTLFHDADVRLIPGQCPIYSSYDGVVLITGKMLESQLV